MSVRRLTDLKFLTAEEQDTAFRRLNDALGTLLIQGRLSREGHRMVLDMVRTVSTVWYQYQANDDGSPREEMRALD